jgi:4-carboxymuconolactone decarboxylase
MSSRYPSLPPSSLSPIQGRAYAIAVPACEASFGDIFIWHDENKALVGPFGPLLYASSIMEPFFNMLHAIGNLLGLTPTVRETAILATGSAFGASYELHAHGTFALAATEQPKAQIEAILSWRSRRG